MRILHRVKTINLNVEKEEEGIKCALERTVPGGSRQYRGCPGGVLAVWECTRRYQDVPEGTGMSRDVPGSRRRWKSPSALWR